MKKPLFILFTAILVSFGTKLVALEKSDISSLPLCDVKKGSVYDGDTLRVICNGFESKIRFACTDAPEMKQEFGEESRNQLRSLLNKAYNQVKVQAISSDKYKRMIAQLWINIDGNWKLLQVEQAKLGYVWAYEKYEKNCPNWTEVKKAETFAKVKKRGLWKKNNSIPPWIWRQNKKSFNPHSSYFS